MKFINRDNLRAWLNTLAKDRTLVAPVATTIGQRPGAASPLPKGMSTRYAKVSTTDEIAWDFERTAISPREFVFPKSECLFTIETDSDGRKTIHETVDDEERVIFGVRPCDASGLTVLDAVMLGQDPIDVSYQRRREHTSLIGLACPQMWEHCFCTSVGGSPNSSAGADIFLTEVEDGYGVEVISEKGQKLAALMSLTDVPALVLPQPQLNESFELPTAKQWVASFDDLYWERVGDRCLSCRACVYVCPTCRCFDVREETVTNSDGTQVTRSIRSWDSCQGANYRVVAGGANPRSKPGQRTRNRFFCKFYYIPENYGVEIACVGCGRCITACPVHIDISEILQEMARSEEVSS